MQQSSAVNKIPGLYGLVACGGKSSRMGIEKCMIEYYDKPQCYWLYDMLNACCEKVFISCKPRQARQFSHDYAVMTDLVLYENTGPAAALLTAFTQFPGKDFLLIGCDYPLLTIHDINDFMLFVKQGNSASFYNAATGFYEPLLACYNHRAAPVLFEMHGNKEYSLQHFLRRNNVARFYPANHDGMKSIDTKNDFIMTKTMISNATAVMKSPNGQ